VEPHTAIGLEFKLRGLLDQKQDRLVVMGPVWEVDTGDFGLEISDAMNFVRPLA
jgi:hypothetical protein